jgi:hypothetical protein
MLERDKPHFKIVFKRQGRRSKHPELYCYLYRAPHPKAPLKEYKELGYIDENKGLREDSYYFVSQFWQAVRKKLDLIADEIADYRERLELQIASIVPELPVPPPRSSLAYQAKLSGLKRGQSIARPSWSKLAKK